MTTMIVILFKLSVQTAKQRQNTVNHFIQSFIVFFTEFS